MNEQEFLSTYDLRKYERPSVTADIAIFAIRSQAPDSYRHNPERQLSILLIRRGGHPFQGCWALPGGFLKQGETIAACAAREIEEETGVRPNALMPLQLYTEPGRDPRGWILSQLFVSVLPDETCQPRSGDDAADARWFTLELSRGGETLTLRCEDTVLTARLRQTGAPFGQPAYQILDSGGLAFDHAKMIAAALTALRSRALNYDLIFDFLPPRFTLSDLQRVQETVTGVSVQSANFRRKVADLVEETDAATEGAGHRPAKLYRRRTPDPSQQPDKEKENLT